MTIKHFDLKFFEKDERIKTYSPRMYAQAVSHLKWFERIMEAELLRPWEAESIQRLFDERLKDLVRNIVYEAEDTCWRHNWRQDFWSCILPNNQTRYAIHVEKIMGRILTEMALTFSKRDDLTIDIIRNGQYWVRHRYHPDASRWFGKTDNVVPFRRKA